MRRRPRGTSFAEVIVSGALIVLVFRLVLSPIEQSWRGSGHARHRVGALRLAGDLVEQSRTRPFPQLAGVAGRQSVAQEVDGAVRTQEYAYKVDVEQTTPYLKNLTVTISWDEGGARRSLQYGSRVQGESAP